MSDKDNTTPESEVKETSEETVNDEQVTEEPTVGSFQEEETIEEKQEKDVPDSIPYDRFQKVNKEKNELEAKLKSLEETSEPVDESEIEKLAKEISDLKEKDKVSEKAAKRVQFEADITKQFNLALENAPEFKDVANLDVIKQLAYNPQNSKKTVPHLLDEAYGNAIGGKRTIESTTPRGGAAPEKVDFKKAKKDNKYLTEVVLTNPEMKKEYNKGLHERIRL